MKIIIIGAGQVGSTLAENLAREYHDITLIDLDEARLQFIQDHHDIRTVTGTGCHPDILSSAGIEDADMLVSVPSCSFNIQYAKKDSKSARKKLLY